MRILVVGAGMYVLGRGTSGLGTILPSLLQLSKQIDVDEVVVCSTSAAGQAAVGQAARETNRRLGTSVRVTHQMVDEALSAARGPQPYDCAIVSVPDVAHAEIGTRVLESGMHCLMVKPFVTTVDDAKRLIALADTKGLYGAVEFHKRFDEANLVVRRMLTEGALGELAYATVEFSQRISIPRDTFKSWSSNTNVFQYLGVHYVDLLQFMTGAAPGRVAAMGRRGILSAMGVDTYDSVHAILEWDKPKFVAQFAIGWIDPEASTAMSDQRYLLVGSNGRIECDQKNRGLRVVGTGGSVADINPYFSEYLAVPGDVVQFSGYGYRSIERFVLDVRDIQQKRVSPGDLEGRRPTFRSALPSTAVIEAVRHSLERSGEWMRVDDAF
jgi:predicted dehydrogenase